MSAYSMVDDRDLELARRTGFAFGTIKRACRQIAASGASVAFGLRHAIGALTYLENKGADVAEEIAELKYAVGTIEAMRDAALSAAEVELPTYSDVDADKGGGQR